MIRHRTPTRRDILALLLSSTVAFRRAMGGPLDQGIGGTGAVPPTVEDSDRGIGGTGVIGTIRKFGSIIVNDMRIAYGDDADIRIDGQPATAKDLRIGQVVRVVAGGPVHALSTRAIDITHEVVGPVEHARGKTLVVLGQTVSTAGLKASGLRAGETVAVSGLRRNDGTIVASLIERRPDAPSRIAGPIVVASDGALKIGNLALAGVDPDLIGRRAVLDGAQEGKSFVVSHGSSEASLLSSSVRTLSIESYVERHGSGLTLGSGFAVAGADGIAVPTGRSVLAVVTTSVGSDGRLSVDSVRTGGQTFRSGTGETHHGGGFGGGGQGGRGGESPAGRGPGGNGPERGFNRRIPMDFGRDGAPGGGGPGGGGPPGGFGGPGGGTGGGPGGGFGGGSGGGGPGRR